jgi:hypothetical protein
MDPKKSTPEFSMTLRPDRSSQVLQKLFPKQANKKYKTEDEFETEDEFIQSQLSNDMTLEKASELLEKHKNDTNYMIDSDSNFANVFETTENEITGKKRSREVGGKYKRSTKKRSAKKQNTKKRRNFRRKTRKNRK